jgi:hypothetical protein
MFPLLTLIVPVKIIVDLADFYVKLCVNLLCSFKKIPVPAERLVNLFFIYLKHNIDK